MKDYDGWWCLVCKNKAKKAEILSEVCTYLSGTYLERILFPARRV